MRLLQGCQRCLCECFRFVTLVQTLCEGLERAPKGKLEAARRHLVRRLLDGAQDRGEPVVRLVEPRVQHLAEEALLHARQVEDLAVLPPLDEPRHLVDHAVERLAEVLARSEPELVRGRMIISDVAGSLLHRTLHCQPATFQALVSNTINCLNPIALLIFYVLL